MTATADRTGTRTHERDRSIFSRPSAEKGFWSWFTTVDHKKIAILYFFASMFFFVVGGLEALTIRTQLAAPEQNVVSPDVYNQLFTMHGLTMVFFVIMPLGAGVFGNYLLPLMIGARDVAFPRLNALSFWVFLAGGIFLYSSVLLGGLPDGAWTGYATFHSVGPDPTGTTLGTIGQEYQRMLFYSLGLQIAGIASLATAVNFIVTILNMRAPGMTLMRMPVFVWLTLVVAFLLLFAMPVIGVALWQMMFEVGFGAPFFSPTAGGDPLLWQHMFWVFGHPEVYIMILPAFGIVSETLPVFSRKPLFGYTAVVFSGIAIAFMGWGVWLHHMFTVGAGPVANAAFGLTTMFIAVPTGVKIFNWLGTMWGGQLRFTTSMLFAIGLVAMFTLGGLSGVTHSIVPHDYQQHDTYYVVAHFHYVLFGGALFGFYSGLYFWFPKVTGRFLHEGLGKAHFWLTLLGFNLTFGPMHILGLNGMPRRIDTYAEGMGWHFWNLVETVGAFVIALSVLVFLVNIFLSARSGKPAGNDPWDARTLEWLTTSPPPPHNFDVIPEVTARDELWHRKYGVEGAPTHAKGESVRVPGGVEGEAVGAAKTGTPPEPPTAPDAVPDQAGAVGDPGVADVHDIHMPSPSYYPLVLAAGLPFLGWGVVALPNLILALPLLGLGALLVFSGAFGWVFEPSADEHAFH